MAASEDRNYDAAWSTLNDKSGGPVVLNGGGVGEKCCGRLATDLDMRKLESMVAEVPMDDVIETAPRFLRGDIRGRVIVPVAPDLS